MKSLAIAVTVVMVVAAHAGADPLPPLVSWRAPVGCGDETQLRALIANRAGRTVSDGGEPYAVVVVHANDAGFVARIRLSVNGTVADRELQAATCAEVADAVSTLVAAAWGPSKMLPPLLSWRALRGCPEEHELRTRIAERARRTRGDGAEPYAMVEVSEDDSGFSARLHIKSGKLLDTRIVHGATCAEVADAVAWVLALAWAPPPAPVPSPAELEAYAAPTTPRRPSLFHFHVAARSAFDIGTLPRADAGAGLVVGIAHDRHVEIELAATVWASRFEPVMPGSKAGVEVGLSTVSGQICSERVFACIGLELGRLAGRGVELDSSQSGSLDWLAATAGLRWRHGLISNVRLVLDAGAVLAFGHPQFLLDDGTVAFRPTPISARLGIGLEFVPSW